MAAARTRYNGRAPGWLGIAARVLGLIALLLAAAWLAARPAAPDPFYQGALPTPSAPGMLLRSEPFTKDIPAGARGWRILYVTTSAGEPVLASAVVVTPDQPSPSPRPVIAWSHGTTGIVPGCAPSLMAKPFDNLPSLAAIIHEGWTYVGTDYPGLGTSGSHAYLVGETAAHAVLDSVRAARQLTEAQLGNRVVVWGHSQGGNSALWAGIRAAQYAPDLDVRGIAALAPASDLNGLVSASKRGMFGKIVSSYLVHGYSEAYSDVVPSNYIDPASRLIVEDIASRCVGGYGTLFSVLETLMLPRDGIFSKDPVSGPLGKRLAENTPAQPIPAPVLIAQGETDDLVIPEVQRGFVASRCAAGQPIDLRTYPGLDHISLVAPGSPLGPELLDWSRKRFEGAQAVNTCPVAIE